MWQQRWDMPFEHVIHLAWGSNEDMTGDLLSADDTLGNDLRDDSRCEPGNFLDHINNLSTQFSRGG